ncbi:unnamed protein product [Ilex paraguariensis]|uniref:Uncharacterized protein n=1 Tax=Ilex paraguariensis TaxID=185542 RepID=A0ABC8UIF3_9AQUA
MMITHSLERIPIGNKIPLPQQSLANLINLQVRTKLASPSCQDSSSESGGFLRPPSFQSSNISFENFDHSCISDASRSSISFQPPSKSHVPYLVMAHHMIKRMARHEEEEKKKVMEALARFDIRYRKYTREAIKIATSYFSSSAKIGE